MRRLPLNGFLIALAAALGALVLTFVRPNPEGLMRIGFGDRGVRAAPGQPMSAAKHDLAALDLFNMTLVRIRDAYVDPVDGPTVEVTDGRPCVLTCGTQPSELVSPTQ